MRRGEIRWYTFAAPDKRRPVLLLTRTNVIDTLNEIIVAPATRTCALNFDHVTLVQRSRLGAVITELMPARWPEIEQALLVACDFGPIDRRVQHEVAEATTESDKIMANVVPRGEHERRKKDRRHHACTPRGSLAR